MASKPINPIIQELMDLIESLVSRAEREATSVAPAILPEPAASALWGCGL
jgi:hypothetical protein